MTGKKEKIITVVSAIILFSIFFASLLITYNYTQASGDLGEYINNPLRILSGDMPYRDFWLIMGPGEVYLPAAIYKIFGVNVDCILLLIISVKALMGTAVFLFGKILYKNTFFAVLAATLIFLNGKFN